MSLLEIAPDQPAKHTMPETDAAVITLAPAAGLRVNQQLVKVLSQAAAHSEHARQLVAQARRLLTETQALRQAIVDARRERLTSPADRGLLRRSEQMRLMVRLTTMPVIEQAKGIIMIQSHCEEHEAFDILRRASQRSNVPVRDLATRIVAQTGQDSRNTSAKPGRPAPAVSPRPARPSRQAPAPALP